MTRKLGLLLCVIFLITSCKFKWKAHPWEMGDAGLVDSEGEFIPYTDTEATLHYTCFHKDNLAELMAEIDRVNKDNSQDFDADHYLH